MGGQRRDKVVREEGGGRDVTMSKLVSLYTRRRNDLYSKTLHCHSSRHISTRNLTSIHTFYTVYICSVHIHCTPQ